MYFFQKVKLTPEEIEFLQTTDFDMNDISDDNTVDPGLFVLAVGLDGYEMGNLKITEDGSGFAPIDTTKAVTEQDVAMMASYIKQQVRDTYGVQLMLKD